MPVPVPGGAGGGRSGTTIRRVTAIPAPETSGSSASAPPQRLAFGPFVLDPAEARLRRDGRDLPLRPKAFELLRVLAARAGQLVTKDELLDAVWGTRFVTEGVIKTTVGELRDALGDDPKRPRWIETVPRRGYRFAAPAAGAPSAAAVPTAAAGAALVGRDAALAALGRAWQAARGGERRVVFVSGDAGVGKTALASAFVESLDTGLAAHGQCVESFGRGEPYLPWLEALASLAAGLDDLPALLRRLAPSWLAHLPWLQDEADRVAAPAGGLERMPREMAALLEQIGQPLVLVLEDLHWSDHASVQLLDFVARRRAPARLLLLATFRATELLLAEHPLAGVRRELRLHRLADEIGLDGLDPAGLRRLLAAWCPGAAFGAPALAALHAHTEGVPLFARAVVDALEADGVLQRDGAGRWRLVRALPQPLPLPDDLAGLFEQQFLALAPAQRELLEAAAVAGVEFDAAVLAAALGRDAAEVHARCDGLVRGGRWLQAAGVESRAGGPPSGRYRFGHALMHGLGLARCGAARRIELHRGVAAALLERHRARGDELAAELAYHYEQALDADAALPWLRRAVEQAWQRLAPHERLALAERALRLLPRCSAAVDATTKARWRFDFCHARASALAHVVGYEAPAAGAAIAEALAAGSDQPVDEELLNVYRLAWLRQALGGRFAEALALADAAVARATAAGDAACEVQALAMLHFSAFKCGAFDRARQAIARAEALSAEVAPADAAWTRFFVRMSHERALIGAMMDTLQGHAEAVPAADVRRRVLDPDGPAVGVVLNATLCELWLAWRGDARTVADDAQAMLALIEREGLTSGAPAHRLLLHWAEGASGAPAPALPPLRAALDEIVAGGRIADRAAFLELAADLALRAGDLAAAGADLDAAFAHVRATGERYILPRLWQRRVQIAEAIGDRAAAARARGLALAASASPAAEDADAAPPRAG